MLCNRQVKTKFFSALVAMLIVSTFFVALGNYQRPNVAADSIPRKVTAEDIIAKDEMEAVKLLSDYKNPTTLMGHKNHPLLVAHNNSSTTSTGDEASDNKALLLDGSNRQQQQQHEQRTAQNKSGAGNSSSKDRPIVYDNSSSASKDGFSSKYHVVFSTDCSSYQQWQSYLVFYSAMKVRQPGHVTQIASGCSSRQEKQEMQAWFDQYVAPLSSSRRSYHLHLTPHFASVNNNNTNVNHNHRFATTTTTTTRGEYKYFNKPFGLRHWMEHELGFGGGSRNDDDENNKTQEGVVVDEDVVVILIDPDQILLRPLVGDFSNSLETILVAGRQHSSPQQGTRKVEHGKPFAQKYGLGTHWQTQFNLTAIAGPDSPALDVSHQDNALDHYPAGPPYLATARDMYQLAKQWTEFAPKVYEEYPHLLAEMYALCIAAAHLKLPFQLVKSLMVSDTGASGSEGWDFVDRIPPSQVCTYAAASSRDDEPANTAQQQPYYPLPSVLHFCHRYGVGRRWFFDKRRLVPPDIFSCSNAARLLLDEPPPDVIDVVMRSDVARSPTIELREAFMVCTATKHVNEAALFFRQRHCSSS